MQQEPQPSLRENLSAIAKNAKKLGLLYITKARIKTTEKLTILLSTIAFTAVIVAVSMILLVFVTIGVGHLLATSIAPHMAYLIMAAFYLVLLIIIIFLRRPLFINPIARFMSRLLVEPPAPESERGDASMRKGEGGEGMTIDIDYDRLAQSVVDILERKAAANANGANGDNPTEFTNEETR